MLSLHTIQVVDLVIGQVQSCANPDQLQMAAIVALVATVLFGFGGSLMTITAAVTAVATTIVQQILAGASIPAILAAIEAHSSITATIAAAINADITTTTNSVELVGTLVAAIKQILGC